MKSSSLKEDDVGDGDNDANDNDANDDDDPNDDDENGNGDEENGNEDSSWSLRYFGHSGVFHSVGNSPQKVTLGIQTFWRKKRNNST